MTATLLLLNFSIDLIVVWMINQDQQKSELINASALLEYQDYSILRYYTTGCIWRSLPVLQKSSHANTWLSV